MCGNQITEREKERERGRMGMESSAIPFFAMVVMELAQVGLMVAAEAAMATGMTAFTFITYSNLLACLILIPTSILIHRYVCYYPIECGMLLSYRARYDIVSNRHFF